MSDVGGIFRFPDGDNPPEMQIWNNAAFDNGDSEDLAATLIRPSSWCSNSLESNSIKENLNPVFESSSFSNSIKSSEPSIPFKPLHSNNVVLSNSRDTQVEGLAKEGLFVSQKSDIGEQKDTIDVEIEAIEKEIRRLSSKLEALRRAKVERSIIKCAEKRGRIVPAKFMEQRDQCIKFEEPTVSSATAKINRRGVSLGTSEIFCGAKPRGVSLGPTEIVSGAKSRLLMSKPEMVTPVSTQNRRKSCFWKLGDIDELKVTKERGKSLSVSPKSREHVPKVLAPKQAATTIGSKRPVKKDGVLGSIQPKLLFKDGEKSVPTNKKPAKPGRVVASRYNQAATNQLNGSLNEARKRYWPENDKEDVNKRRASRGNGVTARMDSGRVKKKWEIPKEAVVYKGSVVEDSSPAISVVDDEFPKIRTNRCSDDTPRDSGAAKRVADLVGRKSYFCADEEDAADYSVCQALSFQDSQEQQ